MAKRLQIQVDGKRVYSCSAGKKGAKGKIKRLRDKFWPRGIISEYTIDDEG